MGRWNIETKRRVADLLDCGLNHTQIAQRLGITKHTVAYHARTLGRPADPRFTRRYDWAEIQRYYDQGHSVTQCQERFGFARETWNAARRRGAVVARPKSVPLVQLLVVKPEAGGRWNIKRRLLAAGLKEPRCERCGIEDWRASRSSSRCITSTATTATTASRTWRACPNCHSQTENFAGRNVGARRDGSPVRNVGPREVA